MPELKPEHTERSNLGKAEAEDNYFNTFKVETQTPQFILVYNNGATWKLKEGLKAVKLQEVVTYQLKFQQLSVGHFVRPSVFQ